MKKVSLFLVAMLALSVAFVGCKKNNDDSTTTGGNTNTENTTPETNESNEDALSDTDWLIGTWEIVSAVKVTCDIEGEGITPEMKEMLAESFSKGQEDSTETVTKLITEENVGEYAEDINSWFEDAKNGPQTTETTTGKVTIDSSVTISSDKTKITYITTTTTESDYQGMQVKLVIVNTAIFTKQ